jgi:3-deoxy-D-manno-octulosonic-acid transferase
VSAWRVAYTALIYGLLPRALLHLAWRGRRQPAYREHRAERFGRYDAPPPPEPVIWIHAVSVGETRAAEPLVQVLRARHPQHRILLTHMTPTGRRTGADLFADTVSQAYIPYDYPGAVRRFLDHFRPQVGLIMETEVWPNLVLECAARGIPLHLVNARLSEKSFRGYARFAGLARLAFGALAGAAAQTAADADRLRILGARNVVITGNVKFDVSPQPDQIQLGRSWRAAYGERPVLLAASTRDGEEALLLDAYARVELGDALLVIVPRHPQRFDDVAALLEARGLRYARRSTGGAVSPPTQVLLGDSMGEMTAYYAACDVALTGGSVLPFGGQNFIEACAVGTPVVLGPHTYNFSEAAERAIEAGAAVRGADAEELMQIAKTLLRDRTGLTRMSERALTFSRSHQGATGRILDSLGCIA